MHEFLVARRPGDITAVAKDLIKVRDYIDDMPETGATFRLSHVDGVNPKSLRVIHMEFLKTWPIHEIYGLGKSRYVNPHHPEVHQYSDVIVECECGVEVVNAHKAATQIREQGEHNQDCLPHYRMKARSELMKMRYNLIKRLTRLGWKGVDIAKRLGTSTSGVGAIVHEYGTTITELRQRFKKEAGDTYAYLVREQGVDAELVSDMYNLSNRTLIEYYREHGEYELGVAREFGRNEQGEYAWTTRSASIPGWLKDSGA